MKINCSYSRIAKISDLKLNPENRNIHPTEQIKRLAEILKYNGWRYCVKVSNQSGMVTSGHGRIEAAILNGWDEVPVDDQDYESSAHEYADTIADNAIASWAELNLAGINKDIIIHGPELKIEMLGMRDFKIEPAEKLEPQCDEDEVPEVKESFVKPGDIWQLGNHRLMCADSTSIDAVEKLINGERADMVFTDPPYRMQAEGGINQLVGKAARKLGESIKHLCDFDPNAFLQIIPTVFDKQKMNAYVFCNKDLVPDYLFWAVEAGYNFNILFWKKPTAIPLGGSHRPDVEYLLLFRKSAIWNNGLSDVDYSKCLQFGRVKDKEDTGNHPTPKPVALIENEIKISSNHAGVVIDFFGGSGSTLIACEKTGRRCFMAEIDPHYCGIIIERWQKYSGKKAEILNA